MSTKPIPASRLESLRELYRTEPLPDGRGYSAYVKTKEKAFGYCWGSTAKDAWDALDCYVMYNHASEEVQAASLWEE